jgi:carbamoyl-phosphate synthase small subunit
VNTIRKADRQEADLRHLPGNQLLGLALGGKTYKLKFGHRGANHPVRNELTKRVEITSHNHGFRCRPRFAQSQRGRNHSREFERSDAGRIPHRNEPVFCVQYHPEAAPGPHDSHYLFDDFTKMMREAK